MKAIVLHGIDAPLSYEEVAKPQPQAGQALVKMRAASFNRRDYWIQKGQYAGLKFPIILGSDGAGIVESVGEGVSTDWIGKEVILNPSLDWGSRPEVQSKTYRILGLPDNGTFAEYTLLPAQNLYQKPDYLSFNEAAAFPLAALTAYRALFTRANLQKNERVLITGIGGGVAVMAFQLAKAAGAEVYVTSSSDAKLEKVVEMGAAGGINYVNDKWSKNFLKETGGFDVIVDSAGGEGFSDLIDAAAAGGRIVFYGGTQGNFQNLSPQKIFWKQLSLLGSTMGSDDDFKSMLEFVQTHKIKPIMDSVHPLKEAQNAIQLLATSAQLGKIVLEI